MTTPWNEYIDENCNYTQKIKEKGLKYSQPIYMPHGDESEITKSL